MRNLWTFPYCTEEVLWLSERLAKAKYDPRVFNMPTKMLTPPMDTLAAGPSPNRDEDPTLHVPARVDSTIHGRVM